MNVTSVLDIAEMSGGKLVSGSPEAWIGRVVTDSRIVTSGDLFIALQGEKFDAHSFVDSVSANGASAIMVHRKTTGTSAVIKVNDTLLGLQTLAKNYRKKLKCLVVGITGSNGKTSTKDLTATIFSSIGTVTKTAGNLNNHIGLPLSILQIDDSTDFAVLEMGMNHAGEIAPLADISAPNIVIITNIGIAHIEHLKTQDAIALEKGALAAAVDAKGTVILNANDPYSDSIAKRTEAKIITAGIEVGQVYASELSSETGGTRFKISYQKETTNAFLPVPGRHMVANAMLAIAAGLAAGISLSAAALALGKIELSSGRLEMKEIAGISFIDDTYNANPDSMIAALITLGEMPARGKRIAVLGAMGELGSFAEEGHRKVGKAAEPVDLLVTVGQSAEWIADEAEKLGTAHVIRTIDTAQASAVLLSMLQPGDCVLVKGSRSARMEHVIDELSNSLLAIPRS